MIDLAVGAAVGVVVGYIVGVFVAVQSEAPTTQHIIRIANTRTNDGARLLGAIEDELEQYGIGSDCRPEIHFHQEA